MHTSVGLSLKPVRIPQSGLMEYQIVIPNLDQSHGQRVLINPDAFTHKLYPSCDHCTQLFVPIEKDDKMCFKCKLIKHQN